MFFQAKNHPRRHQLFLRCRQLLFCRCSNRLRRHQLLPIKDAASGKATSPPRLLYRASAKILSPRRQSRTMTMLPAAMMTMPTTGPIFGSGRKRRRVGRRQRDKIAANVRDAAHLVVAPAYPVKLLVELIRGPVNRVPCVFCDIAWSPAAGCAR